MNNLSNAEIINQRRVINGKDDGLMQVSPLKHPFADEIFQTMLKNNWVPQEVNLQEDVEQWQKPDYLSEQEKNVMRERFKKAKPEHFTDWDTVKKLYKLEE